MTPQFLVRDEVSRVSPLGVRFWDVAMDKAADDVLTVSVYPAGRPELRRPGLSGKRGVYSFRSLPGMGQLEMGAGDDTYWLTNEGLLPFTLEVTDYSDRYLPFQLSVRLPHRGVLALAGSPLELQVTPDLTWLPAFSTPSRGVDAAFGVIRAQLLDDDTHTGAASALVEVRAGSAPPAYGLADRRGAVAVPIPYPEPDHFGLGSPFGSSNIPITQQTWPVQLRVFYSRLAASPYPDLDRILSQPPAHVWADAARLMEFVPDALPFGRDLILRSRKSLAGPFLPELLVTAAGSPF